MDGYSLDSFAQTMSDFPLFVNPDYGNGCLRRRILLTRLDNAVVAEQEDDNHAFRIHLEHNNDIVTDIKAETLRIPMSTCNGAADKLKECIGSSVSQNPRSLGQHHNPKSHCTHLFDLAGLAITHITKKEKQRLFDIAIHDEKDGLMQCSVALNQRMIFHWNIRSQLIENEGPWQGVNVQKGFSGWVENNLAGDEAEAALSLSRAYFISITRRVLVEKNAGMKIANDLMTKGVCYTYSKPAVDTAYRLHDTTRDFTDSPDEMLSFSAYMKPESELQA
ncbi:MAG: DUF2889 domain-containing protein [Pseudomonadales bacterium]|nr:DUF2889 domain-containing protein [Pseudomonadales bacterium]